MNMHAASYSHPTTFPIQSTRNVFTQMMFSNSLGDQGTCLAGQQSRILMRFFGLQLPSTLPILFHRSGLSASKTRLRNSAKRFTEALEIESDIPDIAHRAKEPRRIYDKDRALQKRYVPDLIVTGEIMTELETMRALNGDHEKHY